MADESEQQLWLDIATDFRSYAVSLGITDVPSVNAGDTAVSLMRKVSIYTARIYNLRSQT